MKIPASRTLCVVTLSGIIAAAIIPVAPRAEQHNTLARRDPRPTGIYPRVAGRPTPSERDRYAAPPGHRLRKRHLRNRRRNPTPSETTPDPTEPSTTHAHTHDHTATASKTTATPTSTSTKADDAVTTPTSDAGQPAQTGERSGSEPSNAAEHAPIPTPTPTATESGSPVETGGSEPYASQTPTPVQDNSDSDSPQGSTTTSDTAPPTASQVGEPPSSKSGTEEEPASPEPSPPPAVRVSYRPNFGHDSAKCASFGNPCKIDLECRRDSGKIASGCGSEMHCFHQNRDDGSSPGVCINLSRTEAASLNLPYYLPDRYGVVL